ncbi:MFS transporter [Paenibacillus macerans]|uniref:MFS transporter n=1 Tax=Paenibacillus macerans TaxID=44252 RepID=UPI002E1FBB1E|nr:MFS transporter [Paenibacillus macerans]MED4955577.1 MFS transporter [Paenibacillus macerans]
MSLRSTKALSFWFVAYALLMIMMGANIPAPLYSLYGEMWGFSSGVTSLLFMIYVVFLVPASLIFGQLSDRIGRKKILLIGVIVAAAGSLLFALSQNVGMLMASRAVQGIGVGAVNGTAIAALSELRPDKRKLAALAASVSIAIGTASGPLYSGLLAEYSASPVRLPYYLHLLLILPALLGVLTMPETALAAAKTAVRLRRPGVPAVIRKPFFIAACSSIIAWTVAVFFMSLAPSTIAAQLHIHNFALSGAVVCLMLGSSTISQISLKSRSIRSAKLLGFMLLITGIAGFVSALHSHSLALLLLSTVLAGAGHGPVSAGSMQMINEISPPETRADVMSSFYAVTYLGAGLPVLILGFGAERIGFLPAILIYSGLVVIAAIALAGIVHRYFRRSKYAAQEA